MCGAQTRLCVCQCAVVSFLKMWRRPRRPCSRHRVWCSRHKSVPPRVCLPVAHAVRAEPEDVVGPRPVGVGRRLRRIGFGSWGLSESTERFGGPDGGVASGCRAVEMLRSRAVRSRRFFGSRSVAEGPVEALRADAFRYTDMYALEYGFVRDSSRLPRRRPRLPLLAKGRPKTSVAPARQPYWAAP